MATGRVPTTANSPLTAKGDLFTYSTASARLAVGNNGEILIADSSTSTGLRYQVTQAAGRNILQNGNYDIWQRGTTSAAIAYGTYLADRWKVLNDGTGQNSTYSQNTSVPNAGSLYSAKVQQLTSSATSVQEYNLSQIFEASNTYQLCGKTVTLSFWYRSNKTGSHYARIYCVQTGGTDVTTAFTVSAANTWEYKTITFASFAGVTAISTAATANGGGVQIGINTYAGASPMTIAANDFFQIAQVQLEAGSVATNFTRCGGTIQGELAACQRYYYRTTVFEAYGPIAYGYGSSGTVGKVGMNTTVTMRIKPSAIDYSAVRCDDSSGINITLTSITIGFASGNIMTLLCNASSGFTANRPVVLLSDGSSSSYVGLSSEL